MFKLTEAELENAFQCISHHGFSTLFPEPPEWQTLSDNWESIKTVLSDIDLDEHRPFVPLKVFAPKTRFNLRAVTHLHPTDLVLFTALVLILRDDIEGARIPKTEKRVFSFRSDGKTAHQLYQTKEAYKKYKEQLQERASKNSIKYVAVADIADFFPRIYQHRLENVVETVSTSERATEVARVLVKKMMPKLLDGTSYGIPIGPYASRNLAEALLIDVDSAIKVKGLNFVRWVDDFAFFCKSDAEAQHCLFFLGQWLFEKHGLTLQSSKTKIVPKNDFIEGIVNAHENQLEARAEVLKNLWGKISPYEDEEEELSDEDIQELEVINFKGMLEEALEDLDDIDYDMIVFLIGRISSIKEFKDEWRITLIDTVLDNVEHLYPISDSLARFFKSFHDLPAVQRKKVANKLLKPILKNKLPPPDYYVMWVLSVFIEGQDWNNADKILTIFQNSHSDVVKRYAALAISENGERSHALALRDAYDNASPLLQLAILTATKLLGKDERKYWRRAKLVRGPLEKLV